MWKKVLIVSLAFNLLATGYVVYRLWSKLEIVSLFGGSAAIDRERAPHESDIYLTRNSLFEVLPMDSDMTVMLGNSLTAGGEWQELLHDAGVRNRGIGGDGVDGVYHRLDQVLAMRPRRIFLMIGINDLLARREVDDVIAGHERILDRIKAASPGTTLVVQSLLPLNEGMMGMRRNELVLRTNQALKELCSRKGVPYLDLHPLFVDEAGQLREDFTSDGIHLTGQGYLEWARMLRSELH